MTDSRNDVGAPYPQRKEMDDGPQVIYLDLTPAERAIVKAAALADLRAKVEALRDESWLTNESAYNALTQALALIDGGSDD